jgi:predicted ferric reductase
MQAWTKYGHTGLESPLLWQFLPRDILRSFYALRWRLIYPFQKRLVYDLTVGELVIVAPIVAAMVGWSYLKRADVKGSSLAARVALELTFATASHNSVFTFLLGIPFDRAIRYHKMFAILALALGVFHGGVAYGCCPPSACRCLTLFVAPGRVEARGRAGTITQTCVGTTST